MTSPAPAANTMAKRMKFSPIFKRYGAQSIPYPRADGNGRGRWRALAALAAACLAAAACTPQGKAPGSDASGQAADPGQGEAYNLRGQWSVSRIAGKSLDFVISFTGSAQALTWQPACAGQTLSYRTSGDMLEFYRVPRDEPQIVCEIGYPEDLPRLLDALEGRWNVSEQDNGDLRLTRGARHMVLEKGAGGSSISLAGEWRVAGIDGEDFDEPHGLALSADEEEIWWEPRCARQSVRYRIVNDRFIVVEPPAPSPAPPGAEPPPPLATCTIGLPPRLVDVMTAIDAADHIERTPENGVRLSGNGRSVTLFSQ